MWISLPSRLDMYSFIVQALLKFHAEVTGNFKSFQRFLIGLELWFLNGIVLFFFNPEHPHLTSAFFVWKIIISICDFLADHSRFS